MSFESGKQFVSIQLPQIYERIDSTGNCHCSVPGYIQTRYGSSVWVQRYLLHEFRGSSVYLLATETPVSHSIAGSCYQEVVLLRHLFAKN